MSEENELFGEQHEQEENGLFGKRHESEQMSDKEEEEKNELFKRVIKLTKEVERLRKLKHVELLNKAKNNIIDKEKLIVNLNYLLQKELIENTKLLNANILLANERLKLKEQLKQSENKLTDFERFDFLVEVEVGTKKYKQIKEVITNNPTI